MLSLILPVHCEEAVIESTLARLSQSLKDTDYEILVVDDASTDRTPELVEARAAVDGRVFLLRKHQKAGAARAIDTGVRHARGAVLATMNADLQHPPELLRRMLQRIEEGCDVVVASRYVEDGNPGMGGLRIAISRLAIGLARLVLPRAARIRDPLAGYFMFRREAVEGIQLLPAWGDRRVSIGLKYLLAVLAVGRHELVCEVPCRMSGRKTGRSKFSAWDILTYLRHVSFLLWKSGEIERMAKFCAIGASAFLLYEIVLVSLTSVVGLPYVVSSLAGWTLGVGWSFVLNQAFTFADVLRRAPSRLALRVLRFVSTKSFSLVLHLLVLALLAEVFGLAYWLSGGIAVALSVAWNYAAGLNLVWGTWHGSQDVGKRRPC